MKRKLLDILACPMCKKHPLELIEIKTKNDEIVEGAIYCTHVKDFLIIDEIPVMFQTKEIKNKKTNFFRKTKILFLKKLSNKENLGICDKNG